MFRFPRFPHEPLARFRLLALWLAETIALLNVGLFAFSSELNSTVRWEGSVAALLLSGWWLYGYRRGAFPAIGWLIDAVLVTVVSAWSPMPLRAIGVFYAGIQFRALYVPRRQLMLLPIAYGAARIASFAIGLDQGSFVAMSATWWVQIVGLTVIAITLHLFAESTQRHTEIERALKQSDERYRLVAGATRDAIYDWDVDAGVVQWTESMEHVFGFPPAMVRPELSWWLERVHPDDCETLREAVAKALADKNVTVDTVGYRVRRADDRYVHVTGSMLVQRRADGSAHRVVGSLRDVTAEFQLEEQLRQSQKMEAVGQLAGGVAHDFNNLLTVIGGHVFMLEQTLPPTAATERHLSGIKRASERAAMLTRQLLAFSRRQILTPTVLNLNDVAEDVLGMMRPVIGEHIQIITHYDENLPSVFADAGQLGQVLVNLALNARDAMREGGTLTVETGVEIIQSPDASGSGQQLPAGQYVRLIMRDTGVGMDAPTLARAFEPFFTTKPSGSGTGLGLATAYGIVKQSFGDIRAESGPGKGSAFTVLLPVTNRPSEDAMARSQMSDALDDEGASPRRVLLVEDDPEVRAFAEEVLERAGFEVYPARNGLDALAHIEARRLAIDVVVTDVVMPEMGGRELVEHLRLVRPDLPVLFITGYTDDEQMLGALHQADVRLLTKPFTAIALERAVKNVSRVAVGR